MARPSPTSAERRVAFDLERLARVARQTLSGQRPDDEDGDVVGAGAVGAGGTRALQARDVDLFVARLERWSPDLDAGLAVYRRGSGAEQHGALLERLVRLAAVRFSQRPEALKQLDLRRAVAPDWFQQPRMVGYVCYADRFAGSLRGVASRLDYLEELGVTYLHLMPLLRPREGDSDGGYAVADFRAVDPRLGTMTELAGLAAALHSRGISLCVDLVINHVAREHAWAERARAGDPHYQRYFLMFEDRRLPDAYELTLPEIFPESSPGSFTYDPACRRWVWTTFNSYQWDLDWSNPEVFCELADLLLHLANQGVDVFRLDAVAFIWKRIGSDCQNQPEVHELVQALRAMARIAAPAVIFKAEAIVAPERLVDYLGRGPHHGKTADLAYHNSLMVQIWSALASRESRLMTCALRRFPDKPASTAWATYLRCHDDIGWAVSDEEAAAVGLDGAAHRRFLCDFYSGSFPGSHARGAVFQHNPLTGDRRISGAAASLAGLELGLERDDEPLIAASIERLLLGAAVIFGFGGVPLIYMGDEIGLCNDHGYADDPELARDSRWLHRPRMDWERAGRRHERGTVEERIFSGLRQLIAARKRTPHLHASVPAVAVNLDHRHVLALVRPHPVGDLVELYNFSERPQAIDVELLRARGLSAPYHDRITDREVSPVAGRLELGPLARLWITEAPVEGTGRDLS